MDIIAARNLLSEFLKDPARMEGCFSADKFEGAFAALFSSPEYIDDMEILILALEDDKVALDALLDESSDIFAAVDLVLETLGLQLDNGQLRLHERYPIEACGDSFKASTELCDWIEGYLTVFTITMSHWEAACDDMAEEAGLEEVAEKLREDIDGATSLLAAIHTPDLAFDTPEQAAAMAADLPQLLPMVSDSLNYIHKMGTMLQEQALEQDEEALSALPEAFDTEPSLPASAVQVGRNDPCPCGSGKKYKKCCLN
ncbi:YecA family protein [Marinobacterium jannaschii]|uniref:YecA family protein n=1 Tax=Marinobacterium jannaschii TaxID=64970 RepID=UPI00047F849C|nr:SEC-C metal-binding domain-containing protein [Marinobacterium jannaschii]